VKQAAFFRRKPKFKVPFSDFFSLRSLRFFLYALYVLSKTKAFLDSAFLTKGVYYFTNFFQSPPPLKPWFFHLPLSREQVTTVSRLFDGSNHYNFNYCLHRKNIVASSACDCGDPRQDINHFLLPSYRIQIYKVTFFPLSRRSLYPSLSKICPHF